MTTTPPTPSTESWIVHDDRTLDTELTDGAAASQESLRTGMELLRAVKLGYPHSGGPIAALRWIASGGVPHTDMAPR